MGKRDFNVEILKEIKERWSPRAFSTEKIDDKDIMGLLEAARYAPSCFNEQPWRFIVAKSDEELDKMRSIIVDSNRVWADNAPVLIMLLSKKSFEHNDKENYWHMFDAGTAWGYMSIEGERRGLITHAMGGFKRKKSREIYNIPEDYSILTVVAVGKYGEKDKLPEELKKMEQPGTRKNIQSLTFK